MNMSIHINQFKTILFCVCCPGAAYQCSSRGGELELELRDDGRLDISGRAQIILQGTLKI